MVNIGLIITLVVGLVALAKLPEISAFFKSSFAGNGNGDTDVTVIVQEGDQMDNTSEGKPSPAPSNTEPDSKTEVVTERVTELDIAFEEGRFEEPEPASVVNTSRLTSTQFNPIFFETLRTLEAEERRKIETQIELSIPQDIKFSTSLEGAVLREGEQLSRTDPDFQAKLDAEAERSRLIFEAQFGSVS